MSTEQMETAVVTGVSTGIGRAIAAALVADGWRVFGSVRKETDAAAAKEALGEAFEPLIFDVTDAAAIAAGAEKVRAALAGRTLGALVNNAGIAVGGPLAYLPLAELERQFEVNVYGPLRVTQAFLPLLGADAALAGPPGKIVNMSSVAGKLASPFMGPYAMSKHALEAFSDSLRRELLVHGIDVLIVGPGAVRTPIWAKADDLDVEQYAHTEYDSVLKRMLATMQDYGESGLPPEEIGALVLQILKAEKPKVRHAALRKKFAMWILPNLLSKRIVDGFIAKRFGIEKRR